MKKLLFILTLSLVTTITGCAKQSSSTPQQTDTPTQSAKDDSVVVKTLPVGLPTDEILDNVAAQFKNKVIVIDFWATWCPPCMAAMKSIDPIKDKYLKEKKPVVFVYITGETSPLEKWKTTIPTIKGFHYRLKDKEYNSLLSSLGIRGIPTYYIIGLDGKPAWNNISTGGYPGDDTITAEIEKALSKK